MDGHAVFTRVSKMLLCSHVFDIDPYISEMGLCWHHLISQYEFFVWKEMSLRHGLTITGPLEAGLSWRS